MDYTVIARKTGSVSACFLSDLSATHGAMHMAATMGASDIEALGVSEDMIYERLVLRDGHIEVHVLETPVPSDSVTWREVRDLPVKAINDIYQV